MSILTQVHDQGLEEATRPYALPHTWSALVMSLVLCRQTTQFMFGILCGVLIFSWAPVQAAAPEAGERITPEAFQRHFERAFTSGQQAKALALFYWRGVPGPTREGVTLLVQRDLNATLRRTGWLPPEPTREFWSGGVRMRSNLKVIARFAAEFEVEGGERHLSVHEIGIVAGVLYIGLAEPVPQAQSVAFRSSGSTITSRHVWPRYSDVRPLLIEL